MAGSASVSTATGYRCAIEAGDPFLSGLARLQVSPPTIGIGVALGLSLLRFLAAWNAGYLFTTMPVGFFRDPANLINAAMAVAVVAWYAWTPEGLGKLIAGLLSNGVFRMRGDRSHVDRFVELLARRRWCWLAVGATAVVSAIELPGYLERLKAPDAWSMATPASVALSLLWAAAGEYALFRVLTYYALARRGVRRLFKHYDVRIRPLHPDRSGGLAPLGAFSIRVSYLVTLIAAFIVVTILTRTYLATGEPRLVVTPDIALGLGAVALLSAYVYFSLPAVAHDSMVRAKNRLLLRVNRRFEREYRDLHAGLGRTDADLEPGIKRLDALYKLYQTTVRFPVWPFDVQTVSRFLTSWVTPVAIALLTTLVKSLVS